MVEDSSEEAECILKEEVWRRSRRVIWLSPAKHALKLKLYYEFQTPPLDVSNALRILAAKPELKTTTFNLSILCTHWRRISVSFS